MGNQQPSFQCNIKNMPGWKKVQRLVKYRKITLRETRGILVTKRLQDDDIVHTCESKKNLILLLMLYNFIKNNYIQKV